MRPSPIVSRWANELAEQRLIHKIVCGREKHLLDEVEAADFYGETNQRIVAACKSIVAKNLAPDLVTLGAVTDVDTVLLVCDYSKAELTEEWGYDPSNYVSVLKELRKRREAYTAIHNAMAALQDPNNETSTDEVMAMTMESIHKGNQDTAHDMATVLTKTLATIQARQRGEITPVSTGIPAMDDASGGLYPGEMTVIGARPGTGKTALTLQIAEHAAANGHRAVFVSREMSDVQIGERVFARHGVKMGRSRTGKLNDDDWGRMTSTVNLDAFRNILVDNRSTTVAQIRTSCRRWKARGGLDLVCIDYLQLVHSDNNGSRNDQVAAISWAFKELAVELDVPVLLLSQLSREIRSRQDGEPQLTDLRDSGAIEQDADNVWLLFSPKSVEDPEVQALIDFNSGESNRAVVAIKIAKARQSIPGIVYTQFIKDEMRFLGTTPEPLPEQIDLGGLYE